jgi:tripartite-type tricarboxylate transporter receptor subunit TctC
MFKMREIMLSPKWLRVRIYVNYHYLKITLISFMLRAPSVEMERGQVQLMFDGLPVAVGNIKAGKLKLQAITGKGRHSTFPDLQTFTEAGLTDYGPWRGKACSQLKEHRRRSSTSWGRAWAR